MEMLKAIHLHFSGMAKATNGSSDIPIVSVTPRRDGKFTLKVSMRDCSSSAGCVYGVDVYRAR